MTTTFHRHWRDVPDGTWRWPNFSPAEIACRGTGRLLINEPALDKLQALRDRLGKPLIVRSAYRSPEHNRAVGGAKASKHLNGAAFDIAIANHDPVAFEAAAREVGFLGFGYYPRSGFMHIDLGPARSWGEPFPPRAVPFAADTPPAREVLAQSRTLKGTGAAGVATVGAAGVEVAQDVLAEAQGTILPLVPYLYALRWLFIALPWAGLPWPFGQGSMTGNEGCADVGHHWGCDPRPAVGAAGDSHRPRRAHHHPVHSQPSPPGRARWSRRRGLDQLEQTDAIHRQMLDAAARRPRSRDDLLDRLRGGEF